MPLPRAGYWASPNRRAAEETAAASRTSPGVRPKPGQERDDDFRPGGNGRPKSYDTHRSSTGQETETRRGAADGPPFLPRCRAVPTRPRPGRRPVGPVPDLSPAPERPSTRSTRSTGHPKHPKHPAAEAPSRINPMRNSSVFGCGGPGCHWLMVDGWMIVNILPDLLVRSDSGPRRCLILAAKPICHPCAVCR